MVGTQGPQTVSTKQQRIAEIAQQKQGVALTSLSHHMDLAWMQEAVRLTRRGGAPGIDGVTAEDYEVRLEANLESLLDRAKGGDHYRAPAVRRVHIPKGNGDTRALGIPTYEDKVLQRAVLMLIEPVYEQEFLPCSLGFRPGRSPHQALATLRDNLMQTWGGVVLELDIRKCFDSFDHAILQRLLRERIHDGVVLRLIGKWLNAGVMEEARLLYPEKGSPQGGVISPLLANIFLHHVLDVWFEKDVKPRLKGRASMVRFADDAVLCFSNPTDARRVMAVIGKRFTRFGLELHPDKTRLVNFEQPRRSQGPRKNGRSNGSFEFLGFLFYWGRTKQGFWVVKHKMAASRLRKSIANARAWLRTVMHWKIRQQHAAMTRKLRGVDQYYGRTGSYRSLIKLRRAIERSWYLTLRRRSQKRHCDWEWFSRVLKRYPLPKPHIRPFPDVQRT